MGEGEGCNVTPRFLFWRKGRTFLVSQMLALTYYFVTNLSIKKIIKTKIITK